MSISSDSQNDSENDFEMLDADIHADMIDIPGLTADQQKVLAVVKNNVTEEGANISTDFEHLGSKFINLTVLIYKIIAFMNIFSGQRQTSRNCELVER